MSTTTTNTTTSLNGHSAESIKATVNDKAAGVYSYAQRSLDRVVPPSSRERAYNHTSDFASARPVLFVRLYPHPWHLKTLVSNLLTA